MKVTKLHIDDYKVFQDFDIDFTDGNGNAQNLIVLAGINGSGKTTLLDVFSLPISGYSSSNDWIKPIVKLNYSSSLKKDPGVKIYFNAGSEFSWHNSYKFDVGAFHGNTIINLISKYIDNCIYVENKKAFDAYEQLRSYLSSILPQFDLSIEFSSLDAEKKPLFKTKDGSYIDIDSLSNGEKQILSYALLLFVRGLQNYLILIDEPEFSLHPSWQNKITGVFQRYASEYNCQVILATHSPQIIGSVKPEQLRLLTKDENGKIRVVEHTPNAYGLTFDRVLSEVMGVTEQRTPEVEDRLLHLNKLIKREEFDSSEFVNQMKEVEDLIGYSDSDLVLMRFEIAKRRKQRAADNQK